MRKMLLPVVGLLCIVMILVSGCGSAVSSSDVNQKVLYPQYSIIRENGAANLAVTAIFDVGSSLGTSVELAKGESIDCNGLVLKKHNRIIDICYEGEFVDPASQYIFRYHNGAGEDIDTTVGAVPAMPTLDAISDFSEGQNVAVNWAGSPGSELDLVVNFPSPASTASFYPTDNGHYSMAAKDLLEAAKALEPGTYNVTIEIMRRTMFPVNAFFTKGGYAFTESIDSKTVKFTKTSPAVKSNSKPSKSRDILVRSRIRPE